MIIGHSLSDSRAIRETTWHHEKGPAQELGPSPKELRQKPRRNCQRRAKDNRLFINAVLWIAKTGGPWRDLPERFGRWDTVWKRFDRWAKKGVWKRVFEALRDPDLEWMIIDSTVVRAHQHAAGAKKKG